MTIQLTVSGMSCGGCAASLQKALLTQPAVSEASVDFASSQAVIESELGVRASHLFDTFDDVPLGSASLAQVHRATLRDGREVAVKVQRPHIDSVIHVDLDALAAIASRADMATRTPSSTSHCSGAAGTSRCCATSHGARSHSA